MELRKSTRRTANGFVVACALGLAVASCRDVPPDPPNIVLVVLDTVRPDHLGLYGYEHETTPFLSSIAKRSAVFENAVSTSSWTAPSTASVFTGLYPTTHGVVRGLHALGKTDPDALTNALSLNQLPSDVPTLFERFTHRGYRAFGVATNINIGPELGFDRGFTRFTRLDGIVMDPANMPDGLQSARYASAPASAVLDEVRRLEDLLQTSTPWILYLHLNDAHRPYHERKPWLYGTATGRKFERAYDSEIGYADDALKQISERLGDDQNTLWVFLSDHGEAFNEHGFAGHASTLYGELNRVVMMFHGPGIAPARIQQRVSLLDVMPTLLDLVRLPVPDDVDGLSLAPLLLGERFDTDALADRTLFAHRLTAHADELPAWSAMRGRYKLLDGPLGVELFDVEEDVRERIDLAQDLPAVRDALREELSAFQASVKERPFVEIPLEPAAVEALRALGYVGSRKKKKE